MDIAAAKKKEGLWKELLEDPIVFGNSNFFSLLKTRGIPMAVGKDSEDPEANWAVVEASKVDLKIIEYTVAGKTIHDAVKDFSDSSIIINGAMFNPKGIDPPKTIGLLYDQGQRLSTSLDPQATPGTQEAKLLNVVRKRFTFGQTSPGRGIRSYKYGQNATLPFVEQIKTHVTGLFSFIRFGVKQTVNDDKDLNVFFDMQQDWRGIGIIGVAPESGYLLFYAREGGTYGRHTDDIQEALVNMGVRDAFLVDGGSSVALAVNGAVVVASDRHEDPNLIATVTNYLVFYPKQKAVHAK
ncbi:phosphodiester glycosidase family protein [Candidatus Manganitrophus noduliformans]|uniref:Phosphodiester glycosidase domain-containing protein n=1 Tax=Candidatus Manganitrophus noduliformans TaxID=2606439 RepID=A0A7X6DT41_9BACT|nr:phosphodiester glycosidase family protein [Candidatus Manganitrophus noduliformans]NKE72898.1 hypothetical protein [Candidatus Manganitrophus noduliformans]